MKIYLLIIISAIHTFLFAQQTEKVTIESENGKQKETYYVLKSNDSIRHGSYQLEVFKNLRVSGFYKNNQKDSIWKTYGPNGKKVLSEGLYLNNRKVGEWSYYNIKGVLEHKYNHTSNTLVYYNSENNDSNQKYIILQGADTIQTILDQPPLFMEGSEIIFLYVQDKIKYPRMAIENGIEGNVTITFTIDSTGNAFGFHVSKGIGAGCDEEALKMVKNIPNTWIPAVLNGQKVSVKHSITVLYSFDK
jgi:periplasmic protein TonB